MQQLESVLAHSIHQYEGILDLLQKIDKDLGNDSPDELLELNKTLADMQSKAAETDQTLLPRLSQNTERSETIQLLVNKRQRIIQEILHLNEGITEKASGVQSLITHELEKLRSGISALSGYRPQQTNQGRIINRTS